MGDTSEDPIDHARTTRQHAGETMKNGANAPGLVLSAVAIVSLVVALAAFATGNSGAGSVAVAVAVVLAILGGGWLFVSHRRVRQKEIHWAAAHPSADARPPTS
jgi:protein-S-isoprenylcysteine O-methyltransferase Ste14